MLNEILKDAMSGITIDNIYRHFKGGYYVVLTLASVESTGEEVVIYKSLQDGRVWERPVSSFRELVPADKENPTGQKYRFERVTSFNNQLNMVSTDNLVKELLRREDCPIELQNNSDKVWRVEYLVGRYSERFIDSTNTVEDFLINNIFNSLDRAVLYAQNNSLKIVKLVYLKQDFD